MSKKSRHLNKIINQDMGIRCEYRQRQEDKPMKSNDIVMKTENVACHVISCAGWYPICILAGNEICVGVQNTPVCTPAISMYTCDNGSVYVSRGVYLSLTVHWAGIQQLLPGGPEPVLWPLPLWKPEHAH